MPFSIFKKQLGSRSKSLHLGGLIKSSFDHRSVAESRFTDTHIVRIESDQSLWNRLNSFGAYIANSQVAE